VSELNQGRTSPRRMWRIRLLPVHSHLLPTCLPLTTLACTVTTATILFFDPASLQHRQCSGRAERGFGSKPVILDSTKASVYYSAATDKTGSINKTSQGKTNFWDHVLQLFGASLPVDEGLVGPRCQAQGIPSALQHLRFR